MSFLTPPPDFDECIDATSILTNNHCTLQDIFYPSPTTTTSSHIRSGSYSPHSPCHSDPSSMEHDLSQQPLFPEHNSSIAFDTTIQTSQPGSMYSLEAPFAMYDQSAWSSYPTITAQYPPLPTGHEEAPSFFGGYQPTESSMTSMLPPTPQPVTPNGYNFAAPMRTNESTAFLSSLHQRQTFTPEASTSASMSISSRSCSPNPSFPMSNPTMQRRPHVRSGSIANASSPLSHYGIPVRAPGSSPNSAPQAWRCAYPNCTSRATFIRGCDLRKHYNRHSKHLFCRVPGCPQSEAAAMAVAQAQDPTCPDPSQLILSGGFSSKKDRARHEAKHNPGIRCEWRGPDGEECGRLFSRMDNMKDHVRRIHNKGQASPPSGSLSSPHKTHKLKRSSR